MQEPLGSLQRRRHRHHHYDHGARTESAAQRRLSRAAAFVAVFMSYVPSFIHVGFTGASSKMDITPS